MLTTGLVALTLLGIAQDAGTPDAATDPTIEYPDQSDVLGTGGAKPNILLLLDDSGSMNEREGSMQCALYPDALETKASQLLAALTGCDSADDGVIDLWADRANFAVASFNRYIRGRGTWEYFDSSAHALESSVESLARNVRGGTPLATAYQCAAEELRDYLFSQAYQSNSELACRNNAIVVMSDGKGADDLADFKGLVPQLNEDCAGGDWSCGVYGVADLGTGAQWLYDYGVAPVGASSDYSGMQSIATYAVFFGGDTYAATDMENLARGGGGSFFGAENGQALRDAFSSIVGDAVNSSRTAFSTAAVQNDGLVSGNNLYVSSFRASEGAGPWFGTTRRYCLVDSDTEQDCFYHRDPNTNELVENTDVVDQFLANIPGANSDAAAEEGGTELLLRTAVQTAFDGGSPYNGKHLYTWNPDKSSGDLFQLARGTTAASSFEELVRLDQEPECDAHRLLNSLYGFTYNVADCSTPGSEDYLPLAVDDSVIGDTMNGSTIALSYPDGDDSQTYVLTNANDGILHIYDGSTGEETAGIIPGDLWNGYIKGITRHRFWDLMTEAPEGMRRRFSFDGVMRLYHDDGRSSVTGGVTAVADGLIQSSEEAFLLMGLGRGGAAYYLMDVGTLDVAGGENPIYALTVQDTGHFANLLETWSAPWVGKVAVGSGASASTPVVAAFPSGHDRTLDDPSAELGAIVTHDLSYTYDVLSYEWASQHDVLSLFDGLGDPLSYLRDQLGLAANLSNTCLEVTGPNFDWSSGSWPCPARGGLAWGALDGDIPERLWGFFTSPAGDGPTRTLRAPDLAASDGTSRAPVAYRVHFSALDLPEGDALVFSNADGDVERISSCAGGACATGWIQGDEIDLRYYIGDSAEVGGLWVIDSVEVRYAKDEQRSIYPSFYLVNVDDWSDTQAFTRLSAADQDKLVVQRFTSDCAGASTSCSDANDFTDLRYMTCPISAEPAVYSVGGVFRAAYFGDECGQIWKVAKVGTGWQVARLLSLNNLRSGGAVGTGASKDFRKIFRKLELVVSRCTGSRSVGLYFGTGNVQLPGMVATSTAATGAYLADTAITDGRDVVGVVWDNGTPNRTLGNLHNVTDLADTSAALVGDEDNSAGWYVELRPSEKALRDPVVLNGVAYFTTYTPTTQGGECSAAEGINRVYAMNACSADADESANQDVGTDNYRVVSATPGAIGGGLTVFVPDNGVPIAVNLKLPGSAADGSNDPSVFGQDANAAMKVRLWRTSLLDNN